MQEKSQHSFLTLSQETQYTLIEKKSRFIGYAFPIDTLSQCKEKLALVKKQEPQAHHHCYAYKIGVQSHVLFKMNDDREPRSTAGLPIFQTIEKHQLTNIMIIVVRYFGGTLLGRGGLIRAYSMAANGAIEKGNILEKPIVYYYSITLNHQSHTDIFTILKKYSIDILSTESNIFSLQLKVKLSSKQLEQVRSHYINNSSISFTEIYE